MNMTLFLIVIIVVGPLIIGWILDLLFGDPEKLPHPIVLFGRWIAWGEKRFNKGENRKGKGAIFAVGSILMTFAFVMLLEWGLSLLTINNTLWEMPLYVSLLLYICVSGILVFYCLAGHTLRKEVRMVFEAVDRSVADGRKQVARIVGRDTSELSEQEIRTAALETLAENLSDGVIAPLFWFLMFGVAGMMAYKMVNTLDSMIGYQNARYKDFGCWAAKIDDVANYIPARITALLMIVYCKLIIRRDKYHSFAMSSTYSIHSAWSFVRKYGPQHASPNSGWPESALAYILDCRFGGPHNYFGEYFYKPYIGTNPRKLNTNDMNLSISVCFGAEVIAVIILLILYVIPCALIAIG